jgi:hypothetical protein
VKGDKGFKRFNPDSAYLYAKLDQGGLRITVNELIQLGVRYLNRAAWWRRWCKAAPAPVRSRRCR